MLKILLKRELINWNTYKIHHQECNRVRQALSTNEKFRDAEGRMNLQKKNRKNGEEKIFLKDNVYEFPRVT